jgi:hypothetical protein
MVPFDVIAITAIVSMNLRPEQESIQQHRECQRQSKDKYCASCPWYDLHA